MARVFACAVWIAGAMAGPLAVAQTNADTDIDTLLAPSSSAADDLVRAARAAYGRRDRARLAALRAVAVGEHHPLAPWVDYWELNARLSDARSDEVEAFYLRWPGTYVEDRLRNDWLLEAGRRRDWASVAFDYPRFRMNDDREVTCYALLADQSAGKDVRAAARAAWMAQREVDEGCQLMAQTLLDARQLDEDTVWLKLRQSAELGRQRNARLAAQLLPGNLSKMVDELWSDPPRYLQRRADTGTPQQTELTVLALARLAAADPAAAAAQLNGRWADQLQPAQAAWIWALVGKQAAQSLRPEAMQAIDQAWTALRRGTSQGEHAAPTDWSDDLLAWHARAALRANGGPQWRELLRAVDAMSAAERADPAWVYWRARAAAALAPAGAQGAAARAESRAALVALSGSLNFYGLMAAEDLGGRASLPARPAPLLQAERDAVRAAPGLQRAQALAALGLRDEARREWNYTLRELDERGLLAAAQWACETGDWQICINTSERTQREVDVAQRYAMPYAREIQAAARANGVDAALVLGIVRQETRFMSTLRSRAGAAGLMQLMPATAQWVARKTGLDFDPGQITDPAINLGLGTAYLRRALDSFDGSAPLAVAAYNAGPGRPRRWRAGPPLDPAVWIENVPFAETRDYVKKVLTNTAVYDTLLNGAPLRLRGRLGSAVASADPGRAAGPADLP